MNGIIVINKHVGPTSRDIINILEKKFNTKKIGHTGTLDPLASGVLVVCIGRGLKIAELLTNHDKEYVAGITLGLETDTLDIDGKIIHDVNVNVEKEKIIEIINSFKKKYLQEVPAYSAVKVNGRKLYQYARSGIEVSLPKKEVEIKDIAVFDDIIYENGKIYFKIKCTVSKGTYIRSLIKDIGNDLGVPAVMNSLERTRQGIFRIEDSYTTDDILNNNYQIINIMDALPDIPRIIVNDELAYKIKNGVVLEKFFDGEMAFIIDKNNNLLALYHNVLDKSRVYKMLI